MWHIDKNQTTLGSMMGQRKKICNQLDSNLIRKFWKSIQTIFGFSIRNSIRFEAKIIRFVRFENFSIRLI